MKNSRVKAPKHGPQPPSLPKLLLLLVLLIGVIVAVGMRIGLTF